MLPTRPTSSDFVWLHITRPNLRGQGRDYHSHPVSPIKLTASATRVFCDSLTFTDGAGEQAPRATMKWPPGKYPRTHWYRAARDYSQTKGSSP